MQAIEKAQPIVPVGTTSVRTLESLYWWGVKLLLRDDTESNGQHMLIDQWDPYRLQAQVGGWDRLPTVKESIGAVIAWSQAAGEGGGKGDTETWSVVGQTRLLIVPGYRFAMCDYLFTNTHQPRSTLMMLVSALVGGHEQILRIYKHALDHDYRFLSYGDSTLLACDKRSALRRLP